MMLYLKKINKNKMITISTTIILLTLIGWICRYINYKKGKYKLNIFEEDPNICM